MTYMNGIKRHSEHVYPHGPRGMLVTTSGYSSGAIELAKRFGIALRLLLVEAASKQLVNVTGNDD